MVLCLGHILLNIYSFQLFEVIEKRLAHVHGFSDDTKLYLSFRPDGFVSHDVAVRALKRCLRIFEAG